MEETQQTKKEEKEKEEVWRNQKGIKNLKFNFQ